MILGYLKFALLMIVILLPWAIVGGVLWLVLR